MAQVVSFRTKSGERVRFKTRKSKGRGAKARKVKIPKIAVYLVQFRVPGSPWVWVGPGGRGTMNPDEAVRFGDRDAAEKLIRGMTGPRLSTEARVVQWKG